VYVKKCSIPIFHFCFLELGKSVTQLKRLNNGETLPLSSLPTSIETMQTCDVLQHITKDWNNATLYPYH